MSFFGRLSSREHYGLRLALRLAETYYSSKPVSIKDISDKEGISMKYLEQLVVPLKEAEWVKSIRGRDGGYLMTRNPETITLKDLIWLLDNKPFLIECLGDCNATVCPLEKKCLSKDAWKLIQNAMEESMEKIRISDILKK